MMKEKRERKLVKPRFAKTFALSAAVFCAAFAGVAKGDVTISAADSVSGVDEVYKNYFTGDMSGDWADASNWDDDTIHGTTAADSNVPMLFDGDRISVEANKTITSAATEAAKIEGWNFRVGVYNGANVTIGRLVKFHGNDKWISVDDTSKLTVATYDKGVVGNANSKARIAVAAPEGFVVASEFSANNNSDQGVNFEYILRKGSNGYGSVKYAALKAGNHKIVEADAIMEMPLVNVVRSVALVKFASTTKTFTAAAAIHLKDESGNLLGDILVNEVKSGATTLTSASTVGSCEIVQIANDGVYLYWVDGRPTAQQRGSINVNFYHDATGYGPLDSTSDTLIGTGDLMVSSKYWDNIAAGATVSATAVNVREAGGTTASGATVAASGGSGAFHNGGVAAGSDLRSGYFDDNASADITFTVTGIPFKKYKAIVYFSNDTAGTSFGWLTLNDTINIRGENGSTTYGNTAWGSAGTDAYTEGGNYLVTPLLVKNDGTLKIVSHANKSASPVRRCGVAAIQIIEELEEIEFAPPSDDWSGRILPASAKEWNESTTTLSFGNRTEYNQLIGTRKAVVANVTGGTYTDIFGLLAQNETTSDVDRDIYLMVGGDTIADRVSGVQNADYQNDVTTSTTGNALVNISGNATVNYAFGAGIKGGKDAVVVGNTGVVVSGNAVIKGTVVGGWSSAHVKNPQVQGNTSVLIENLQSDNNAGDYSKISAGFVVGGSAYEANPGASRTTVTGNSTAMINLASGMNGTFDKAVVGGSLYPAKGEVYGSYDQTQAVNGNSSVSITAPSGVTFPRAIVGGGYTGKNAGSVSTTVGRNASVAIDGGTYTGTIVAGAYAPNGGTATVGGTATLTLKDGVFDGASLMGGNATGTKTLAIDGDIDLSGAAVVSGFGALTVVAGNSLSLPASAAVSFDSVTFGEGATLTFNYLDGTMPALSASTNIALGNGETVTVALGDDVVAGDGATLIAWPDGSSPEGSFMLADDDDGHLSIEKTATGLVLRITPAATVNGVPYANLDDAIAAAGNTGVIMLNDSSIDYSEKCVLVADASGDTPAVIRKKGGGYEVYYKSGYMGTDGDDNFTVTLSDKKTVATIQPGDVVVFDTDDTVCWVSSLLPANVSSIKINGNITFKPGHENALLPNVTITIASSKTLTFERAVRDMKLASMTLNGGSVAMNNATGSIYVEGSITGTSSISIASGKMLNVANGGDIANRLTGEGKVSFAAWSRYPNLDSSGWRGTISLPELTGSTAQGFELHRCGTANSTIEITSFTGWLKDNGSYRLNLQSTLQLNGDFTVNGMSSWAYVFSKIAGSGNFTLISQTAPTSITIAEVAQGYSGTVANNTSKNLTISTLSLAEGATVAPGTNLLKTGGTGNVTLGGVTIGTTPLTGYTWSRKTNGPDGDGIYVDPVATTTGEDTAAVTTVSAAAWQTSAAVALGDDYAGKVVVPPQIATLTTTGTAIAPENVKVKYNGTDITGAFTIGGSAGNVTIALNPGGSAGVVTVRPVPVDVSPVTFAGGGATPTYTVKSIPGLWYKVVAGTTFDGTTLGGTLTSGTAVQADSATVSPVAPAFPSDGSLQYYKIVVGTTNE